MNNALRKALDEKFYNRIGETEISNPKVFITFAGVPYSGRTKIAQKITEELKGLYVDKDFARTLIYQHEKIENTQQPEDILDEYMPTVFDRLSKENNGLIILDASIDRKYDKYKKWTNEHGYKLIVVSVEVDRKIAEETIQKERDRQTAKWFIGQYGRWYADHEKFLAEKQPEFIIDDIKIELPDLLEKLKEPI